MSKAETRSTVLREHHPEALKLPAMHRGCGALAAWCSKEDADHLGSLPQLCGREMLGREAQAARRRLKAARLPTIGTPGCFDLASASRRDKPPEPELPCCRGPARGGTWAGWGCGRRSWTC